MAEEPKPQEKAGAEESKKQPVSQQEMRQVFSGPALAANKIYVTIGPGGVRVTFCEGAGEMVAPVFRTAVQLSFPDAFALRDLLIRQLEHVEIRIEEHDSPKDG